MENLGRREFIKACALLSVGFSPLQAKKSGKSHIDLLPKKVELTHLKGKLPGKRVLVIGGIHGNEVAAYKAADLLIDSEIKRGELFIVARSNFTSILAKVRGYNGDMNRKFSRISKEDPDYVFVQTLKEIIKELRPDVILSLHDGYGYHRLNPHHWGQCIVIDEKRYGPYELAKKASWVIEQSNPHLRPKEALVLHNTRTFSGDEHKEQLLALTGWCLRSGIEAYCLESSRNLPLKRGMVSHLVMLEHFLRLYDIELSPSPLERTKMELLPKKDFSFYASIDGRTHRFSNSDTIRIKRGSNIVIERIEGGRGGYVTARGIDLNWERFYFGHNITLDFQYDHQKRFKIDILQV